MTAPNGPERTTGDPRLSLPRRGDEPVVLQLGATAGPDSTDGARVLAVFVGGADSYHGDRVPVAGRYEHGGDVLSFTPAFGFADGQAYVVRTQGHDEQFDLTEFRIDRVGHAGPALVTAVYPSGDVLPENLLRFHVHFSVPMQPHVASDFIALRDGSGVADDAAFMRFKQELWNADRTRLTILVDPGRIKRSVATNLELGPALREGGRFALTIDGGWPTADGSSELESFAKRFHVGPALRDVPDAARWAVQLPHPRTREALEVVFDRPFDHHGLEGGIGVVAAGEPVDGTPLIGDAEMSWSFAPDDPWTTGDVQVIVDDALEDVAGNNFRELLDRNVGDQATRS